MDVVLVKPMRYLRQPIVRYLSTTWSNKLNASRPEVSESADECGKLPKSITLENQYEILSNTVTPTANLDYVTQLKRKQHYSRNVLKEIKNRIRPKENPTFHFIIPSPVVDHYRNKDEFCIRTGIDGNPKTVGFFVGSPAKGEVVCVEPTHLRNLKPHHASLAKEFQDLIRSSPLRACHDLHDGGFWRSMVVRSNLKGETMVVIICHPAGATHQELEDAKRQILERFQNFKLSSLYFQACPHVRATNEVAPYQLLAGDPYIYEQLGEYTFRISPDSFFQVNVEAAPLLYDRALQFADPSPRNTLLDLCCGTGTVSIFASKMFRGCVGIDSVSQAIKDAEYNAAANYVFNCHFQTGLIEKTLLHSLTELKMAPEISTVLNPGRAGCNKLVMKTLRYSRQISSLIYISCKADHPNVLRNFTQLCDPEFDQDSPPFQLTDFQPVDMFPHTHHCEMLLVFRR